MDFKRAITLPMCRISPWLPVTYRQKGAGGAPIFYHCAGYWWGDTHIWDFSHTHAHGMGVPDYGTVALMPRDGWDPAYTEAAGQREMSAEEITVRIGLGRGAHRLDVWTCDLSHDYVSINADYRS